MNYKLAQALGLWLLPLGLALPPEAPPQDAHGLAQAIKPKVHALALDYLGASR